MGLLWEKLEFVKTRFVSETEEDDFTLVCSTDMLKARGRTENAAGCRAAARKPRHVSSVTDGLESDSWQRDYFCHRHYRQTLWPSVWHFWQQPDPSEGGKKA